MCSPSCARIWSGSGVARRSCLTRSSSAVSRSFLALRVDRLTALEHGDEGLDLLLPSGFRLHVVGAKREREAVLLGELRQHCLGLGLGVDRGLKIGGECPVLSWPAVPGS